MLFNDRCKTVVDTHPLCAAPDMTATEYQPEGGTALWDGIARIVQCAVKSHGSPVGETAKPIRELFAPPGTAWRGDGGNEIAQALQEKAPQGVREHIGHNMSEHRASFEKGNVDADSVEFGGRLASCGKKSPSPGKQDVKSEKSTAGVRRSSGDGMCAEETRRTGDPPRRGKTNSTGDPRGGGRAETGVGEVHSSEEARNERGAKEPQVYLVDCLEHQQP